MLLTAPAAEVARKPRRVSDGDDGGDMVLSLAVVFVAALRMLSTGPRGIDDSVECEGKGLRADSKYDARVSRCAGTFGQACMAERSKSIGNVAGPVHLGVGPVHGTKSERALPQWHSKR